MYQSPTPFERQDFRPATYGVEDAPPVAVTLLTALQHVLLALSSCMTTSSVVADAACVPYG